MADTKVGPDTLSVSREPIILTRRQLDGILANETAKRDDAITKIVLTESRLILLDKEKGFL